MRHLFLLPMRMTHRDFVTFANGIDLNKCEAMKKYVFLILAVSLFAAVSCGSSTSSKSPFTKKELVSDRENAVRAEGTGTAKDIRAAMNIARMNAMTALAEKLVPAETDTTVVSEGGIRISESKEAVVNNVLQVDQRVFRNEEDGTVTVWILLETQIEK